MFGGLAAADGVDAGAVAHECAGVVAESLGLFVDAEPVVYRLDASKCRIWCGPIGRTPAATASWLNRLMTLSGRRGRPARPANMYGEQTPDFAFASVRILSVGSSTTCCRQILGVARSGSRSRRISPHSSPRRRPVTNSLHGQVIQVGTGYCRMLVMFEGWSADVELF
jgi:hypothetical protein